MFRFDKWMKIGFLEKNKANIIGCCLLLLVMVSLLVDLRKKIDLSLRIPVWWWKLFIIRFQYCRFIIPEQNRRFQNSNKNMDSDVSHHHRSSFHHHYHLKNNPQTFSSSWWLNIDWRYCWYDMCNVLHWDLCVCVSRAIIIHIWSIYGDDENRNPFVQSVLLLLIESWMDTTTTTITVKIRSLLLF